eukprot:jgi/Galph1/3371/GphlegSOOS_G2020.1
MTLSQQENTQKPLLLLALFRKLQNYIIRIPPVLRLETRELFASAVFLKSRVVLCFIRLTLLPILALLTLKKIPICNASEFIQPVQSTVESVSSPMTASNAPFLEKSFPTLKHRNEESSQERKSTSFVTHAVKAVGPSVVRIDTERKISTANDPLLDDPFLKKFFGDEFQKQLPRERTERGQGSGFIISKDGLILTNAHVVKNAEKVTVTLTDGRAYIGSVKGTDELLDLAVIRIDPKGRELPVAPLGNSSALQVGDWVIALGNPVGLDNTVTLGIVSSLNRSAAEVGIPEKKIDFIQTDAAINPGNSGGPLVNEFGEVVGINAAIRANAEGIGFAIPIDRAKAITDALSRGKKIQHPFIGIQMSTITPELARQNNEDPNAPLLIPEVEGALIVRILPKTPAAEAGLRRFDVIQAVDGHTVKSAKEIQYYVDNVKVGQVIQLKVVRGGDKTLTFSVKTGDLNNVKEEVVKSNPLLED